MDPDVRLRGSPAEHERLADAAALPGELDQTSVVHDPVDDRGRELVDPRHEQLLAFRISQHPHGTAGPPAVLEVMVHRGLFLLVAVAPVAFPAPGGDAGALLLEPVRVPRQQRALAGIAEFVYHVRGAVLVFDVQVHGPVALLLAVLRHKGVLLPVGKSKKRHHLGHNCLLIPSRETIKRTEALDVLLKAFLSDDEELAKTLKLVDADPLIHDFACVLIAHINLVQSTGMRTGVAKQIEIFVKRMQRHCDWYHNQESVHDHLTQQFDAIELLLTRAVEFNRMRDEETLSECQRILAQTAIQATGASWPKTG